MPFEFGSIAIDDSWQVFALINSVPEDVPDPPLGESFIVRLIGEKWTILRRFAGSILRDVTLLADGTLGVMNDERGLFLYADGNWRDFELPGSHNQMPSRFAHDRHQFVIVGGRRIWTIREQKISTRDLPRRCDLSGGCRYREGLLGCGSDGIVAYIPDDGEIELFRPPHKDQEHLVDIDCCGDAWWAVGSSARVLRGAGSDWSTIATLDREATFLTNVIVLDEAWAIASGNGLFDLRFDGVAERSALSVHAIACTSDHQDFVAATSDAIFRGPDWTPLAYGRIDKVKL